MKKQVINFKGNLFYKGYLDIEKLNKAIDSTGTDGIVICKRENGKITTAVDITRKTLDVADVSESGLIEEDVKRGYLVFYEDILDNLRESEDNTAIYSLKDIKNGETIFVYIFKLLDETDEDNAVYYNQIESK